MSPAMTITGGEYLGQFRAATALLALGSPLPSANGAAIVDQNPAPDRPHPVGIASIARARAALGNRRRIGTRTGVPAVLRHRRVTQDRERLNGDQSGGWWSTCTPPSS